MHFSVKIDIDRTLSQLDRIAQKASEFQKQYDHCLTNHKRHQAKDSTPRRRQSDRHHLLPYPFRFSCLQAKTRFEPIIFYNFPSIRFVVFLSILCILSDSLTFFFTENGKREFENNTNIFEPFNNLRVHQPK